MSRPKVTKVPPDGGYGWVVTFAYALNNVVVLPLIAGFGLVFQEAFHDVGLSATHGTLIITLNHGFGMLLSFFGGPVLRRFGYRKVAITGAIFISAGLMLTAVATSFWLFLFSYSILNSMGVASVMAAFSLAINSYFKEKRSRAVGVGMSITGLGAIYMPLLMSALIYAYGWRYAVLTLGAICLHSLVGACLLRPVKWYMVTPPQEMVPLKKDEQVELINEGLPHNGTVPSLPQLEELKENGSVSVKSLSMRSLSNGLSLETRNAISHPDVHKKSQEPTSVLEYKWWESQEINLGSSINIFRESELHKKPVPEKEAFIEKTPEIESNKTLVQKFVDFFDLTLLRDPIFLNIMFGLSMAGCVETNFSLLFPIILKDMLRFETSQIANLMAVIGFSDTLFRLVSPFIGEWCNKSPRVMYMVSLAMVIFIRSIMLFTTSFIGMIFVALAMGITKGVRTVYMNVVIPNYVPLERLPFASGIQMFFNGIIIITLGTVLGKVRELSGNYRIPIVILNCVTMVTVIMWGAEFLYFKFKNKSNEEVKETTS
ncbi:monocarboxylate transporter 9-like [Cydia fagiglandana]|uniref:monocarboxylate transporter 9-like n=1 Tax=Cydia fagiglandana TaxID=1458189 RepID=UPI002FEE461C